MFDITSDDISQLSDTHLRELLGRLCEGELERRGLSAAAVTWGGNQTAPDGGLDVRVAVPAGSTIGGFIPRPATGFQVKKPDMPRSKIIKEMRPAGTIRRVVQELADNAGAYVIVSSKGATSDSALTNRREALREALADLANADQLHTDFYDRTRLAAWVRQHPGLITWVKEMVGRALIGWRPYGPWSHSTESDDAEYLLDNKLRLRLSGRGDASTSSLVEAIDALRDELAKPREIVRLVGLSGVGKTRLVQALFDARVGVRPLPPSLAVYTNLSENPDPQPTGLASDLIANQMRAVLIVDNCPPDLHRTLSDLCRGGISTVSLLTVEYDVRDDQPEGTQVVTLDTSSTELIEKLVQRRYPHVSPVDIHTIAEVSGGNARIAIALAETVGISDSIAGLSNDELFQRLFRQRQDPSDSLFLAAQACSLVYSFQGEALSGEEAELPRLASLAGQATPETFRYVAELLRRDLVQRRGVWRAVLPHAIANRLAARALEDTPYDLINQQLVEGGTDRLAKSFSRRLSFLHEHPQAIAIVERWLAPDGRLGDATVFSQHDREMFENVAPVRPKAALGVLWRAGQANPGIGTTVWGRHLSLLRSLAFDSELFERSAQMLGQVAIQHAEEPICKEASQTFVSLFTVCFSGTHATLEQRLLLVESLLTSESAKARLIGITALDMALETTHFIRHDRFGFGARSRDYGFQPQTDAEVSCWYSAVLKFIERVAVDEAILSPALRELVARRFVSLWTSTQMYSELESLCSVFSANGFWYEGWVACRKTMLLHRVHLASDVATRLSALETKLRPSNAKEQVRAVVLGDRHGGFDLDVMDRADDLHSTFQNLEATAQELGKVGALDREFLIELLPDLLRGGNRASAFGRGLASASGDRHDTWATLVDALQVIPQKERNVGVLCGFLAQLWEIDKEVGQSFLDLSLEQPDLLRFLPVLQTAVILDERGVERIRLALASGQLAAGECQSLAWGRATDYLAGGVLKNLILDISDQPDGLYVALEILYMRLYSDRSASRKCAPELLEAGAEILRHISFRRGYQLDDYWLADITTSCLAGPNSGPIAAAVAVSLRRGVAASEVSFLDYAQLLWALLVVQPIAVLDELFMGDEADQRITAAWFVGCGEFRLNPADAISCEILIAWCDCDSEYRYPLAASIITFASRDEESRSVVWSDQAKALLTNAPEPRCVLEVFVNRFRPRVWSGSRATILEEGILLLGGIGDVLPGVLAAFVSETKRLLEEEAATERSVETKTDQIRNERFE